MSIEWQFKKLDTDKFPGEKKYNGTIITRNKLKTKPYFKIK